MNTLTIEGNNPSTQNAAGDNLEEIIAALLEHPAIVQIFNSVANKARLEDQGFSVPNFSRRFR